jgi:hypothetical protein
MACKDIMLVSRIWPLIKKISPNINNEIDDVLMEK